MYIMFLGGFVGVLAVFSLFRDVCESFFYMAAADTIHHKAFKVLSLVFTTSSLSLSHFASTWHRYTLNICSVIRGDM